MADYEIKLTPNLISPTTDGSLDTAILNGESLQRSAYIEVIQGSNRKVVELSDGEHFENFAHTFADLANVEATSEFFTFTVVDTTDINGPKRIIVYLKNIAESFDSNTLFWQDFILEEGGTKGFTIAGENIIVARINGVNLPEINAIGGNSYGTNEDNTALVLLGESGSPNEFEVHNDSGSDMIITLFRNERPIEQTTVITGGSRAYSFNPTFWIGATTDLEGDFDIETINTQISYLGVSTADVDVGNSGEVFSFSLNNVTYA